MDEGYNLNGKVFVVEKNDGENTILPPGSKFQFKQVDGDVSATYSGGRVTKGALKGRIIESELHHRYIQTLDDGRRLSGRAVVQINRREDGLLELVDEWAWESQKGDGTCLMVETRPQES
jgi:hypothetical protein